MCILPADGESNVRYGLCVLLEERPEFEVVGEVVDAQGLLAQIEVTCPDLVLLSWALPGLARADLLPASRASVTTCTRSYSVDERMRVRQSWMLGLTPLSARQYHQNS